MGEVPSWPRVSQASSVDAAFRRRLALTPVRTIRRNLETG